MFPGIVGSVVVVAAAQAIEAALEAVVAVAAGEAPTVVLGSAGPSLILLAEGSWLHLILPYSCKGLF